VAHGSRASANWEQPKAGSPPRRLRGWFGFWVPSAVMAGSLPASTSATPGIRCAADTSTERMRAWACGERST